MKQIVSLRLPLPLALLLICVYCTVSVVSTATGSGDVDQEGSTMPDYTSTTTEAETHSTTIAQTRPTTATSIADMQTTTDSEQEIITVQSSGTTEVAVTETTTVTSRPPSTFQTATILPQTESTTGQLDSTADTSAGSVTTEELASIQANTATTQAAPVTTEHLVTTAPTRPARPTVAATEEPIQANTATTQADPVTTEHLVTTAPTRPARSTVATTEEPIQANTATTQAAPVTTDHLVTTIPTRPARPTVATTEEPNTATSQAAPVTTEHLVTTGPTRPARPTVATTEEPNTATTQAAPVTTEHLVTTAPTRPARPTVAATEEPIQANTATTQAAPVTTEHLVTTAPTRPARPTVAATEEPIQANTATTQADPVTTDHLVTTGPTRPARPTVAATEEPNTATTQAAPFTTDHLVTTAPTRPARPTVAATEDPNTATTQAAPVTTDHLVTTIPTRPARPTVATTTQAAPVTTEHLVTTGPTRPARPTDATTEELQANVTTTQTALLTTGVPVSTRPVATTTTEEIASIQADSDTTGAPTEGTTEPPECRVPAYSSINYETTYSSRVTDDSLLVVEGKCYVECILDVSQNPTLGGKVVPNNQFPPWPFSTLKPQNCNPHKFVHECTRGCLVLHDDIPPSPDRACRHDCSEHCQNECGAFQCDNPDSDEWWVRQNCPITCGSGNSCDDGCQLSLDCTSTECNRPLNPIAPPTLVQTEGSDRAGVFSVNISGSVPSSPSLTTPGVVFLFEILDHTTSNYSYHWVVDPALSLDLADFACREVSVRFAVLSVNGLSNFSGPTRIQQIYGDPTRRPNPVTNIRVVSEEDDTRVGYFGHVIWTISWQHPTSQLHLDGYMVDVYKNPDQGSECGERVWTRRLALNESTSVRVMADEPGDLLVMGCVYTIIVHAIGVDENEIIVENHNAAFFPSMPQFIDDIQCNKIWDLTEFKFSFNFTWSLPFYIAFENPITQYIISVDTYRPADSNIFVQSLLSNTVYDLSNLGPNVTDVNYYLPHNGRSFFSPRNDSGLVFRFKLYFDFNESNVRFNTLSAFIPNRQFFCTTDTASPPPSQAQNVTVISYDLLSTNKISLNFSWTPPLFPNGVLTTYTACVSQTALLDNEEPVSNSGASFCEHDIEGDMTSAMKEFNFFRDGDSYCLTIQIRPRNDYVFGEWSEPSLIYLGVPGSCTDPLPTDPPPTTDPPTDPPTTMESTTDPPNTPSTGALKPTTNPVIVIGVSVFAAVIVVLCACIIFILFCYCARRRKRNWRLNILHDPSGMDLMFSRDPHRHLLTQTPTDPQFPEIDEWEISASEIIIEDSLGEGAFGEVYKGVVKGPIRCTRVQPSLRNAIAVPVAIKLLKDSAQGSERQDFLSEIEMMKTISEGQNPNVIGMVGCVTLQEPLSLILEFVEYGDLLSYLRTDMRRNAGQDVGDHDNPYIRLGSIVTVDLVKFSYQIASGMEYLSSLDIVHRDLACRNILVDEGKVLKITDFGMSREVDEIYVQQSRGRVPLKWMALESILTRQFTSASDVWSYGVSLWEIGTMGGFPYPTISNEDLILLLKNGYRMEKPDNCSPEIYAIMLACWNGDPSMRPTFSELKSKFDHMLRSNAEYIYFLPVNSDRPCYQPENAPEGMTLTSPNQIRLSPNANGNRQSTYIQMASTSHSVLPGSDHGRSSGQTSPGPRSPRSISPTSFDPSPSRINPNVAQRSASMLLSRDVVRDKRKRIGGNLYVDNPSKKAQEILAQVRPTSMLVSRPSENGEVSIGTGDSITHRTRNHGNSRHRRPSSAGESSNGTANGVAAYVNVGHTGNGNIGIEVLNPLFGRELSLDENNGNRVPAITVTEDLG